MRRIIRSLISRIRVNIGMDVDPVAARGMKPIEALTSDRTTGDMYYLAVSADHNKMVPAWGADGTGVGKTAPDGAPKWFALSSGGNYMSISSARDAKQSWILAGKSFGGQIDVFDEDGLRMTTGNWGWQCAYMMGFVDHALRRPRLSARGWKSRRLCRG